MERGLQILRIAVEESQERPLKKKLKAYQHELRTGKTCTEENGRALKTNVGILYPRKNLVEITWSVAGHDEKKKFFTVEWVYGQKITQV